jgi:oligopeptide transport system ATP-binding protein
VGVLLEVKNLATQFNTESGIVKAVDGVSYEINEGETLALVGESGCGKSVSALSIMRLIPNPPGKITSGQIIFEGEDLLTISDSNMRKIRGNRIAMIFQEPMTSLNPVLTIGKQITESLELHLNMSKIEANNRAGELLSLVGIADGYARLNDYPHQFSGGMRQRVMIAMGLTCNPRLLIADEPTTALDVTIQAQILELIQSISKELGLAVLMITHNLGVVARYANRVNVMYAGKIIERGDAIDIYANPKHPYTLGLIKSVPRLDQSKGDKLQPIEGMPPDLISLPEGCSFRARCKFAVDKCATEIPPLISVADGHLSACWESDKVKM